MAKKRQPARTSRTARRAKRAAPALKPKTKKTAKRPTTRAARVKPIPSGFHTVTAHLTVKDGNQAIDFYKRAFGAQELMRMAMPDGALMHAEIKIGDSILMLAGENPGGPNKSPATLGGSPVTLNLYVTDADDVFMRAVQAGARVTMPLENQFWGDRYGQLEDPFGHSWSVSTHLEDLKPGQIMERAAARFGGQG